MCLSESYEGLVICRAEALHVPTFSVIYKHLAVLIQPPGSELRFSYSSEEHFTNTANPGLPQKYKMGLCINQQLPPGGHPWGTHVNPEVFVEIVRFLLPEGVGENITFVHRDCTPVGRPWGFAGQRYTLSTIPGCCSRCSLRSLVARDVGLKNQVSLTCLFATLGNLIEIRRKLFWRIL